MSLETELRCEGAPRDLGRDIGLACGERVRSRVGKRNLGERIRDGLGLSDPPVASWLRDVQRYFPHQYEWLEGLAHAVDLPVQAVARTAMAVLESSRSAILVAAELDGAVRIWRGVPATALARQIAPEGRFVSIELGAAISTAPWIGVNDRGLAVAISGGARTARGRSVHGALFARDCLERFDALESALSWCVGRPAAPGATILLADAGGGIAGITLESDGRPVKRAEDGVLVMGGDVAAANSLGVLLRKLRSDSKAFEAAIQSALVGPGTDSLASVDPSGRSLIHAEGPPRSLPEGQEDSP